MPSYRYTFISHAHADNALCDPYQAALARLGVPHYYDRANPQIGHDIGESLERELEQARALVVLASPQSLASPWVREEINIFFALMMRDTSRMLIPVKVAPCDLPPRLEARWWVDGSGRIVGEVAAELAHALEMASAHPAPTGAPVQPGGGYSRVVDWRHGMGDHTTITEAIAAARPGERILVRKGRYEGGLKLDKPMEIVGDGAPGDVEIYATGADVIKFTTSQGRVANLTILQTGGGLWDGVDIGAGRLDLEDCDISSQGRCGIFVHDGADPRVRRCRIHDDAGSGILIESNARGVFEDCDIVTNALSGVEVKTSGAPTMRRCQIHDGKQGGLLIHEQGQGLFEDCEVFANTYSSIEVKTGGAPTVRKCHLHDGAASGAFIHEQGRGLFEDCDIVANGKAGIEVKDGGAPTVRRCRFHDGAGAGVFVQEQGQGLFEDCEVFANTLAGIEVKTGGAPTVRRCHFHDGAGSGVFVHDQGQGLFEDCDIVANGKAGIEVKDGGAPTLRKCRINQNTYEGIWVYEQGGGVYDDNDLRGNTRGAWDIAQDSAALVTRRGNTE